MTPNPETRCLACRGPFHGSRMCTRSRADLAALIKGPIKASQLRSNVRVAMAFGNFDQARDHAAESQGHPGPRKRSSARTPHLLAGGQLRCSRNSSSECEVPEVPMTPQHIEHTLPETLSPGC